MPLATYSDLQAAVASWLARDDLTAVIPDFIVLFEAVANRRLRVRQMEADGVLTPANGTITLPSDFLSPRRVTVLGDPQVTLDHVAPDYLYRAYPTAAAGTPQVYTIAGSELRIRPTTTTPVNLAYYQRIPALSSSVNWLFSAHADLYLFGALTEAQAFMADGEKAALWKGRRDELFAEVEALSEKAKAAGQIRVMGTVV